MQHHGTRTGPLVVVLGLTDDAASRVAAALLGHRARGRARAVSLTPTPVPPDELVCGVLAEAGVDLRAVRSRPLAACLLEGADVIVVMGRPDQVRLPVGCQVEDWCIDDPRGKDAQAVRCIRDALDRRAQRLLARLGITEPQAR